MSTIYIKRDEKTFTRKILADMPFLATHKQIRLPKYIFEEGLYITVSAPAGLEIFKLTQDNLIREDNDYFYFPFPFKLSQAE